MNSSKKSEKNLSLPIDRVRCETCHTTECSHALAKEAQIGRDRRLAAEWGEYADLITRKRGEKMTDHIKRLKAYFGAQGEIDGSLFEHAPVARHRDDG